jgi:hypothetical protein
LLKAHLSCGFCRFARCSAHQRYPTSHHGRRTRCEDHGLRHSEFNVAWVWGSVPQLVSCLSQERSRSAKGRGANSDLSRNITGNNGRLALVNGVIVLTVPMDDVAYVRHVAPTGISCLVGAANSYSPLRLEPKALNTFQQSPGRQSPRRLRWFSPSTISLVRARRSPVPIRSALHRAIERDRARLPSPSATHCAPTRQA